MNIGYVTDPVPAYVQAVKDAGTLDELRAVIREYELIAGDALDAVNAPDFDFAAFTEGRRAEARRQFAGQEWAERFGAIILPDVMVRVSGIADHFNAPWGCAYIRCKEEGFIIERDGRAIWVQRDA